MTGSTKLATKVVTKIVHPQRQGAPFFDMLRTGRWSGAAASLILATLVGAGCHREVPVPEASSATDQRIQPPPDLGSNALARVTRLAALGPRDAGTPGAERAARWIEGELRQSGLAVTLDTFEDETPVGSRTFHNVVATLPGKNPEQIVLLSHFDTKAGIAADFIGANDGGSSTGLLLALAECLSSQPRESGLIFAFLDGEECLYAYGPQDGLHGSRKLARQMRQRNVPVRAVILLDMVGDHDLRFTLPRNGTAELKLLLLDAAAALGCRDRVKLLDHDILDDHQPFLDHGFPAVNLIDFEYGTRPGANDLWHTPADTLDQLSAESLRMAGAVALEVIRRLEQSSNHGSCSQVPP